MYSSCSHNGYRDWNPIAWSEYSARIIHIVEHLMYSYSYNSCETCDIWMDGPLSASSYYALCEQESVGWLHLLFTFCYRDSVYVGLNYRFKSLPNWLKFLSAGNFYWTIRFLISSFKLKRFARACEDAIYDIVIVKVYRRSKITKIKANLIAWVSCSLTPWKVQLCGPF